MARKHPFHSSHHFLRSHPSLMPFLGSIGDAGFGPAGQFVGARGGVHAHIDNFLLILAREEPGKGTQGQRGCCGGENVGRGLAALVTALWMRLEATRRENVRVCERAESSKHDNIHTSADEGPLAVVESHRVEATVEPAVRAEAAARRLGRAIRVGRARHAMVRGSEGWWTKARWTATLFAAHDKDLPTAQWHHLTLA